MVLKKISFVLRTVTAVAALAVICAAASCSGGEETRKPSIPSSTSSAAESELEIPSFVDTDVDSKYNLALIGTAFADSVSSDYPTYGADKINDGDRLTRWMSKLQGTEEEPSTFGIEWDADRLFDVVVIYWEAHHPAEEGFEVKTESGSAGETVGYRVVRSAEGGDDEHMDVILFDEPVLADKLSIICTVPYYSDELEAEKDTPSCYEIEVYYSDDIEMEDGEKGHFLTESDVSF